MKITKILSACLLSLFLTGWGVAPTSADQASTAPPLGSGAEGAEVLFSEDLNEFHAVDVFLVKCTQASRFLCASAADAGGCGGGDDDLAITLVGLAPVALKGQGGFGFSLDGCSDGDCLVRPTTAQGTMQAHVAIACADCPDAFSAYNASATCFNDAISLTNTVVQIKGDQ